MTKSSIKFFYETFPIIDNTGKSVGKIARPIIDLWLNYKHGKMFGPVQALIDSGADYNLFPTEVANIIGIRLTKGVLKIIEGIGDKRIKTYRHLGVKMFVEGYSFETFIDFSHEIKVPLLGQQGFFDKFKKISFDRVKEEVILKTK